jgi:hypothetical protein
MINCQAQISPNLMVIYFPQNIVYTLHKLIYLTL